MLTQHTSADGFRYYTDDKGFKYLGVTTVIGCVSLSTWKLIRWGLSLERQYMYRIAQHAFSECVKKGYTDTGFYAVMREMCQKPYASGKFSKAAQDNGKKGHKEIENWIHYNQTGEIVDKNFDPQNLTRAQEQARKFLKKVNLPIAGDQEQALSHPEGFGGTCDYIPQVNEGEVNNPNLIVPVDWKFGSSKDKYDPHGMQLAAYTKAGELHYGLKNNGAYAVYFKDEIYQYYSPEEIERLYEMFLSHLLAVHARWEASEMSEPDLESFT